MTDKGFNQRIEGFTNTDYYNNYKFLLTNKDLVEYLAENKYTLKFLLHQNMEIYLELFWKLESENIKILSVEQIDYKDIFKESKLIITDYSSAVFDFAYLKKLIIYFQFIKKCFLRSIMNRVTSAMKKMTLDQYLKKRKKLVDAILQCGKKGFVNEENTSKESMIHLNTLIEIIVNES